MKYNCLYQNVKKAIPVGSPLWYPQFYGKRLFQKYIKREKVKKVVWHVVHQNILLENQKAIYIHIPKVACSTMKSICANILNIDLPTDGDFSEEIHLVDFPCAKKYQIYRAYRSYFTFAFVRNPWDRLVSCYKDKINYPKGHVYERYENTFIKYLKGINKYKGDMQFEDFVETICSIPDRIAEGHFRSQYLYLTDEKGSILPNFVGRFENLSDDYMKIKRKLKIDSDLPHIRSGKRTGYKDYYTENTKKLVRERYAKDIELFGYKF